MNPFRKITGIELRAWREKNGISVEQLAEQSPYDAAQIEAMEAEKEPISFWAWLIFCTYNPHDMPW